MSTKLCSSVGEIHDGRSADSDEVNNENVVLAFGQIHMRIK